ncbi:MAG TPA: O-antigen ligase family protein [Elainellaceae cyanobacterium]
MEKAHTNDNPVQSSSGLRGCQALFRISLVTLPYLLYPSLLGLLVTLIGVLVVKAPRRSLDPLTQVSLIGISILLVISSILAANPDEAFLQLSNFLPFFWLFATLPTLIGTFTRLEQIATDLVIAALPIQIVAAIEYVLKSSWLPTVISQWSVVEAIRAAPHRGRAMVMFDHPNALASYLVIIFGLGLGLTLKRLFCDTPQAQKPSLLWFHIPVSNTLLYVATGFNLFGLFASGSRNGLLVAICQIIVFGLLAKAKRAIVIIGAVMVFGLIAGAAWLGLGHRPHAIANLADDPRIGIWKIALDLIQERPWFGWGLGNFKILYPPRLIDPTYQDVFHPHNIWLLLGSEAGLPVMIAVTVMVSYSLYRGIRLLRSPRLTPSAHWIAIAYFLAFGGCVVFALFDVTLYDARVNVLNWLALAGIYTPTILGKQEGNQLGKRSPSTRSTID